QDYLIELAVAESPEQGTRPGARATQNLHAGRDAGLPGAPRAVGQHEDLRPLPFEPAMDAELVARMRDHQGGIRRSRHGESLIETRIRSARQISEGKSPVASLVPRVRDD